ncbi:MarR family transcriptional regulator [Agromyces sp. ISL-38]|uniref:MarR family winged helix-turn-helix transcriptional regulator n=1 Tax=Agromyces sp. ISL-38 TaxID=2819107 RepID=UPI001BE7EF80|nr:MarR family transcriptional regulator [Agromyces sp. ISL-38]MBT2498854.1 MarR family transcriptional regulator [Agromyces sp. ISL-38]MBT2516461.1 MarR family transcriptional regulator [Streptomyces sp. ISL-90]
MVEPVDLGDLFQEIVNLQMDLFAAVDQRLRSELDMLLISLLPMRVIAAQGPCRVQDIAAALQISVGGASKSVDRIERLGWCRRSENPGDRRSSLIELTPRGHAMLMDGNVILEEEMQHRVADVLGPDSTQFARALERLRATGADVSASPP